MDAIKIKFKSVAFLALVSVTVTGLPIAPPQTHYPQQPVQTEQFHPPQYHEHRQRNQDDRFEHPPMNLHDICAHHSQDTRHLELCHPKLGPRSYPRPYQPDPHMSNAFPKQDPQIRIRRGPEQQGNSFPKESYFINRDPNVPQEQRIPTNRNHPGTRGPTGRHSINRTPFESIPSPFPPQDLNQSPCPGPGCPPHQNPQQRSPQHIHAPIIQDPPPTIPTNSHHPWQQFHGPAQRSDPTNPSQNPYKFPNDSPSIKPNYNDDMRNPMATRGNPANPQAAYASKLKDSKPCSLSSSSGSHYGKSCRILIIYDFSDADVTYETKLETFEG